jgi:uncharacterized repeat protein (TIGR02543 family)
MKKFNLIEMLQGCSKRNGTTFRHSNPDGQPTVNRQSRLMSYRGNLKNLAMLFAVLVLSIANIGMAWGATEYAYTVTSSTSTTDNGKGVTPRYTISFDGGVLMKNNTGSSAWSAENMTINDETVYYLVTGSSTFTFKTTNAITGFRIYGSAGTGSNRTISSIKTSTTTSDYSAILYSANNGITSKSAIGSTYVSCVVAANTYVEVTLSGNIYLTELVLLAGTSPTTTKDTPGATGEITFENWVTSATNNRLTANSVTYWKDGIKFYQYHDESNWSAVGGWYCSTQPVYLPKYNTGLTAGNSWGSYSFSGLTAVKGHAFTVSVTEPCEIEVVLHNNTLSWNSKLNIYVDDVAYGTAYATNGSKNCTGTNINELADISHPVSSNGRYVVTIPISQSFFDANKTDGVLCIKFGSSVSDWGEGSLFFYESVTITTCEAPSTVTVGPTAGIDGNYGWRYTTGQTIDLTCTATGGSGEYSYQWQKYVNSAWTDIIGATSARYQKASCTYNDGGSYRCVVSTGEGCSKGSDEALGHGYYVRVFTLDGNYYGSAWNKNAITWTGENTGTVTLSLEKSRTFEFKVRDNDQKEFGYTAGNYIIQPWSNDCGAGDGTNIRLFTGPAGDYTITLNVEHANDVSAYVNVDVAYPSVTHPADGYIYLTKWSWDPYVHYWDGFGSALTADGSDPKINTYTEICEGDYYWYFPVLDNYVNFLVKDNTKESSATNKSGSQTTTSHSGMLLTNNGSWVWQNIGKTISFDANGGSGTMDDIEHICSGSNQTLPANSFTREGWTFTGWNTEKHGKGTAYAAGDDIDVTSDITLYAQWERTVYLKSDLSWWYDKFGDDEAWFSIYYWDSYADSNKGWVEMELADCETDVYKATLPGNGYNNIIFVRKTTDHDLDWDNVNNQSVDVAYPTTNPKYTITSTSDSKVTGSWGTFSPTTYTVTTAVSTADYGEVSAASVTGVACGTSISASTNTLSVGATNVTATPAAATDEYTYAFDNWAWTPAGSTVTSDVTATATFTRTPKSYTLTWNLAGGKVTVAGTGAAVNATGTPNSEVAFGTALTAPTVTKTGYNFSAWSPSVASTMPAAATTYTATWTAKQYKITYKDQSNVDFSGLQESGSPSKHTYGSETILKTAFKDSYVFGGWYTSSDCSTGLVTSIGATDYTANFTLYAKWTEMSMGSLAAGTLYKVGDMVPKGYTMDNSAKYYPGVSANNLFNIRGSSIKADNDAGMASKTIDSKTVGGETFTAELSFRKPASGTDGTNLGTGLPNNHAIQFKISGDGLLDIYCYYADSIFMVKDGGSAAVLSASDKAQKVTKEVTAGTYYLYSTHLGARQRLYGLKFTPTYTVTLNDNGGKGDGSSSVTVTYNSATIASITNPTKDGYIFGGWYSGSGGTGSLVIDANGDLQASVDGYTGAGGIWTKTAATTLYAYWISNAVYDPDMSTEAKLTATLAAKFGEDDRWTLGTGLGVPAGDAAAYLTDSKYGLMFPRSDEGFTYDLGDETTIYKITLDIVAEKSKEDICSNWVEFANDEYAEVDSWEPTMKKSDYAWDKQTLIQEFPTGLEGVRYIEVFGLGTSSFMGLTRFKVEYAPTKTEIVLDNQSATTAGTESVTATYGASTNLTSSITAPSKTGYIFGGYYTEEDGKGTQLIDANGAWLSSQTGYTDGSKNWQFPHPDLTLYAKWIEPCFEATITKTSGSYALSTGSGETKDITSDATVTSGGAVKLVNNYAGSKSFSFSSNGVAPGTSDGYVEIVFPSGSALGVGSIIRITGAGTATDEGLLLIDDEGNTIASQTKNGAIDFTYTVTAGSALKYKDHIRIARAKTNSNNYFKSVSVLYCASCAPYTPTLNYSKTTIWMDDAPLTASPTLNKDGSTGSVTYSSSNTEVVTVDPSTGVVTAVARGTATIIATIAADGTHCDKSATCDITVKDMTCGITTIAKATRSGTSASYSGVEGGSALVNNLQTGTYKLTSGGYVGVQLPSTLSFEAGDIVRIDLTIGDWWNGASANELPVVVYADNTGTNEIYRTDNYKKLTAQVVEFEVTSSMLTALATKQVTVYRKSSTETQNHVVNSVEVKRYSCPDSKEFLPTGDDGNWNATANWIGEAGRGASLPTISDRVIISKPVTVDIADAKAQDVLINQYSGATGKVTVSAGKALIIADKLQKTTTGSDRIATAATDVIINSDRTTNGVGALVIGGETGTNKATVNFETKAKNDGGWVNQYIGSPFSDNEPYVDYALQLYKFCPKQDGDRTWWQTVKEGDAMTPFWGYDVLYNDKSELTVNWTGTLNASSTKELSGSDMYYNGAYETDNMFANSWLAPIHVGEIEDSDVSDIEKTFYLFNAGTPQQDDNSSINNTNTAAGTYVSMPIHSAEYAGIGVIPAMQGFYVVATGASPSLTLNYEKVVYTPALTAVGIQPNRAPKRTRAEAAPEVITLHVQSETGWAANTYVMGREDFAEGYEDGWDGAYIEGESQTPKLYTPSIDGNMFINCLPQIEGTVVSFRKGSDDSAYTFSFKYDGEEEYYLNDLKEQTSTLINNENTYMFSAEAEDATARFIISATPVQKVTTGVDPASGGQDAKVRKVIINDHIYIIRGGRMYSVDGALVR